MRAFDGSMKRGRNSSLPIELGGDGRFVCRRENFVPAYLRAFEEGILQERADEAIEALRSCRVCPRNCKIDRLNNKIGVCKSGRLARVASAFPHFGEEDCLRGWNGSGTIFFGWCTREIMRWIAGTLSRDTYVNVMDQYYPAHKAETEPRFSEINRRTSDGEFCHALESARAAGLWRLDTRWRNVIPHGAPVWLPMMQRTDDYVTAN
jgi:uncharacterized Fe-S radical SAM superfamily protein PflX